MKGPLIRALTALVATTWLIATPAMTADTPSIASSRMPQAKAAVPTSCFQWRDPNAVFDPKPAYLILLTEDALLYSQALPDFVRQKESMGFRVHIATEKDYASGKSGQEQALHLRSWLRSFHQRCRPRYALFIGDTRANSPTLPAMNRPDGDVMDEPYRDLDGLNSEQPGDWVENYLRDGKIRRQGSRDELLIGRISLVGDQVGNSLYDLDRILQKFIRYEKETVAGVNLEWRSRILSLTSNYGNSDWDDPLAESMEKNGGGFEYHSSRWIGDSRTGLTPENFFATPHLRAHLSDQLHLRDRPCGMLLLMSHAWSGGEEGLIGNQEALAGLDDSHPVACFITGCHALDPRNPLNMGQSYLRRGAIFVTGTSWSNNFGGRARIPQRIIESRKSVGEALSDDFAAKGLIGTMAYGDPSLVIMPPDRCLCKLQVHPVLAGHYEERPLHYAQSLKPVELRYSITNNDARDLEVEITCDAPWLSLSNSHLRLSPGQTEALVARSNAQLDQLPSGRHLATVRFHKPDGQVEERRLAVGLLPTRLTHYFSFNKVEQNSLRDAINRDLLVPNKAYLSPAKSKDGKKTKANLVGPGVVGDALLIPSLGDDVSLPMAESFAWRGFSASFWLRIDALPEKNRSPVLTQPAVLNLSAKGELTLGDGQSLGTISVGKWHFIQVRSDCAQQKMLACLDGGSEVSGSLDAKEIMGGSFSFGRLSGNLDELKIWSGEISPTRQKEEFLQAKTPLTSVDPVPADGSRCLLDTPLIWRPADASPDPEYDVYLSTSAAELASATPSSKECYMGRTSSTWMLPGLRPNTVYHWRVDTVNQGKTLKGQPWSFKTLAGPTSLPILHPLAEVSLHDKSALITDQRGGFQSRLPVICQFAPVAQPGKTYLYFKAVDPEHKSKQAPPIDIWCIDTTDLPSSLAREQCKTLNKVKIATQAYDPRGQWIDVSAHVKAGRKTCFYVDSPQEGLHLSSVADPDAASRVFSDHECLPASAKLICYPAGSKPAVDLSPLPKTIELSAANPSRDLAPLLLKSSASTEPIFSLLEAPAWLNITPAGVLCIKNGDAPGRIDYGGYQVKLRVRLAGGATQDHLFKVCLPLPGAKIKFDRSLPGAIGIVAAGTAPLGPGVIRYTLDGSPVTTASPAYTQPIKTTPEMKLSARFFLYDQYPMECLRSGALIGIPQDTWKVIDTSQGRSPRNSETAFDGLANTSWVHTEGTVPQYLAWDLGAKTAVKAISCQSAIANSTGRIKDYVLYASDNGKTWTQVSSGILTDGPDPQVVKLPQAVTTRYLKIEAISLHAGEDMELTELEVFTE